MQHANPVPRLRLLKLHSFHQSFVVFLHHDLVENCVHNSGVAISKECLCSVRAQAQCLYSDKHISWQYFCKRNPLRRVMVHMQDSFLFKVEKGVVECRLLGVLIFVHVEEIFEVVRVHGARVVAWI